MLETTTTALLDFTADACPVYLDYYDRVIIAFSGGKDSVACVLRYLEAGGNPKKLELWHHKVDGLTSDLMDWPCTNAYCQAFAAAFGVPLYFTWKVGGFEGEMLRQESRTQPICFEAPQPDGSILVKQTGGARGQQSTRRAFPQISADLSVRWCSSYLKIDNARTALRNQERFNHSRTLFISGERGEESPGRAKYARFEVDDSDARKSPRLRRHIDRWRPVHHLSEKQVWDIIQRWRVNPHPAYRLGWSRCSCAACIFNGANEFATLRLIFPRMFYRICGYEKEFQRTVKRTIALEALADLGTPFPVQQKDVDAALSDQWLEAIVLPEAEWRLPPGAFSGGAGPS